MSTSAGSHDEKMATHPRPQKRQRSPLVFYVSDSTDDDNPGPTAKVAKTATSKRDPQASQPHQQDPGPDSNKPAAPARAASCSSLPVQPSDQTMLPNVEFLRAALPSLLPPTAQQQTEAQDHIGTPANGQSTVRGSELKPPFNDPFLRMHHRHREEEAAMVGRIIKVGAFAKQLQGLAPLVSHIRLLSQGLRGCLNDGGPFNLRDVKNLLDSTERLCVATQTTERALKKMVGEGVFDNLDGKTA